MIHLPDFSPHLDDRLTAEFLELSLELLPLSLRQDAAMLDRAALRFTRPEPPRDPDLPLLPPKAYPLVPAALAEAAARSMTPPPAPADIVGRKPELDRAVNALATGRTVAIGGPVGAGKTALLRLIAHD
ncbi:MAG: hypothetical protein IT323_02310, partial [Anaerolineae bacterium]|nr:hypothetical protein [Anaerolineae bacterium]